MDWTDGWALVGACLILLGFVLSIGLYLVQNRATKRRDRDAARAVLEAVRTGLPLWAQPFDKRYMQEEAARRAEQDRDAVLHGRLYMQVFRVPSEPLAALIQQPTTSGFLSPETIATVNYALRQIAIFNQFVQQQTDFTARYGVEILDPELPEARRRALADLAFATSFNIEWGGVHDGVWFQKLRDALHENACDLRS